MLKHLVAAIGITLAAAACESAPQLRGDAMTEPAVTLADIGQIHDVLSSVPQDGHFAVLLFGENGQPPKAMDALNVQFSIDGGSMGLDWVLLAPDNVAAEPRVTTFLETHGYEVQRLEMNDVRYLRVEGDGLAALGRSLLAEVFGVTEAQMMYLIPEGFDWPPDA